ncbi:MAG: 4Fe-4S binding protein [Rhodospirillaceae bacterium]|nr:4Fe-4S binding protein [Rhodospirillaceae bacterium]
MRQIERSIGPRWLWRALAAAVMAACTVPGPAKADMNDPLATRITPEVLAETFPGAEGIKEIAGDPPIASVLMDGEVAGYAFSTHETVHPQGYSGESFDIIVGLGLDSRITGTTILETHEPMLGPNLIPVERMSDYLDSLTGMDVRRPVRITGQRGVDGVAGATISATAMHSAIIQASRKVARIEGMVAGSTGPLALDRDSYDDETWAQLEADGSVATLDLTRGEVADRLGVKISEDEAKEPFVTLHVAIATPAGIGRNLFGAKWYTNHLAQLELGEHLLVIMGEGPYSWRGPSMQMTDIFQRIQIVQGDKTIRLTKNDQLRHTAIRTEGAPRLNEIGLFRLSSDSGFDVLAPWRFELLVDPQEFGNAAGDAEPVSFSLPYRMPARYVLGEDADLEAAGLKEPTYVLFGLLKESGLNNWQRVWISRLPSIAGLGALLLTLTGILFFQDAITRRRRLHRWLRLGFLAVVVVWLGWMMDAQLTIINVISYFSAAFDANYDWAVFLIDPLVFILSVYVALTLLLWGRGVFCGWLCPFGALQELLANGARWLKVPQVTIPETLQTRLWTLKYVVVVVIAVIAVYSMSTASKAAEVEPFKTAIILGFDRAWPYVLYAGLLLTASLFIERFFCRFMCPLGGALTILGRFHLLHWLKRRPQCGNPCHVCEKSCPVGAVHSDGKINMNECFQCLDCQVDYYDDRTCPPLAARRKRISRLAEAGPSGERPAVAAVNG